MYFSKNHKLIETKTSSIKRKKMEQNKVRFFMYGFKINNLVGESLSFVAVFLLESLERILMAKLTIELGLVANEVASL